MTLSRSYGRLLAAAALVALGLLGQFGCGATCDRIEKDREKFLGRKPANTEPHMEAIVPFAVANELVAPQIEKVKPIDIKIPGMGKLGDHFGELTVVPSKVEMRPAKEGHVGFKLTFEVRDKGKRAFELFANIEIEPQIDIESGKVVVAFTPEALAKVEPRFSKDAKKDLGALIYKRLPKLVRMLLPKSMVESLAGSAVKSLIKSFYRKSKDKLLPRLAELSTFEFQLPPVPLKDVRLTSTPDTGGALKLVLVTGLPVSRGLREIPPGVRKIPDDRISIRVSGSATAELVNWAMSTGLVPDRYDAKGKAKKNGELRPGLAWENGAKRPMRVFLWDLDKPCMRITLKARPVVEVKDGKLQIQTKDTETDDVEASAFTKVGVWFYILWKDAIKLKKKATSRMEFAVAGRKMVAAVESAEVAEDEIFLGVGLNYGVKAKKDEKEKD